LNALLDEDIIAAVNRRRAVLGLAAFETMSKDTILSAGLCRQNIAGRP
jgi:hypothetical protein